MRQNASISPRLSLGLLLPALACFGQHPASRASQSHASQSAASRALALAQVDYDAGRYAEAEAKLQPWAASSSQGFNLHELLGLCYAVGNQPAEAIEQLEVAARLKPASATAHINLATALIRSGKPAQAQEHLRKALTLDPHNYDANRNLAQIYLAADQLPLAIPLLAAAQRNRPNTYDNGYDLALAYLLTGELDASRNVLDSLATLKDTGELHNLRGRIDEQQGKFVEAANEFAAAAHLDPSEDNLFVWASELLLHRTYDAAIEVFHQAVSRYPQSPRLSIGLGMALYSRGEYEPSIEALLKAADLDPSDARCYLFLSKAYLSSPGHAEEVIERFRRYAALEPGNALAQYYYAVAMWKGRRLEQNTVDYSAVESLLQKSVALDPTIADAHLQLGILYSEQHQYAQALPEYQQALALNQNLPDAHYRLGQYYVHAGEKEKAQAEFDLYKQLQSEHQAQIDKERADVKQFVISKDTAAPAKP